MSLIYKENNPHKLIKVDGNNPLIHQIFKTSIDEYNKLLLFDIVNLSKIYTDSKYAFLFQETTFLRVHLPYDWTLIYPVGFFYNMWNLVMSLCLVWLLIIMPITLARQEFEDYPLVYLGNTIVNSLFMFDIFLNFNTGYFDEYGNIVESRGLIAINYLSTWFAIDFFSSVPLELIMSIFMENPQNGNINSIGKFLRFPKYYRILKMVRSSKLIKSIENTEIYKELQVDFGTALLKLFKIFKSFLYLIIACHFMSNMVVWVAATHEENWWTDAGLNYSEILQIYSLSWFWSVQTVSTVGYGDLVTSNEDDLSIKILSMFVGVVCFSIFINNIMRDGDLNNDNDEIIEGMDDKERDLIKYTRAKLEHMRFYYKLSGRNALNFEALISKQKNLDLTKETQLIDVLKDTQKRNQVYQSIFNFFKKSCKILKEIELEVFIEVYSGLTQFSVVEDDIIVSRGEEATNMFIINQGKVAFYDEMLQKYSIIHKGIYRIISMGEEFCIEDCIIFNNYITDIYANEYSDIYKISKEKMSDILDKYDLAYYFLKFAEKSLFKFYQNRYATIFILQLLLEQGEHIYDYDILDYIKSYKLEFDYSLMQSIWKEKLPDRMYTISNWWSKYLDGQHFLHLINYHAQKTSDINIMAFLKTIDQVKKENRYLSVNALNKIMKINDKNTRQKITEKLEREKKLKNYMDVKETDMKKWIDELKGFDESKRGTRVKNELFQSIGRNATYIDLQGRRYEDSFKLLDLRSQKRNLRIFDKYKEFNEKWIKQENSEYNSRSRYDTLDSDRNIERERKSTIESNENHLKLLKIAKSTSSPIDNIQKRDDKKSPSKSVSFAPKDDIDQLEKANKNIENINKDINESKFDQYYHRNDQEPLIENYNNLTKAYKDVDSKENSTKKDYVLLDDKEEEFDIQSSSNEFQQKLSPHNYNVINTKINDYKI